jgi:chromosome partitioning protein
MISSKGGAGKTTASLVLAGEIAFAGKEVILIDADPNRPLEAWAAREGRPSNIAVVVDESAETIVDTIEEARRRAGFVIVDVEGTATDRICFAVSQSDLVLIPVQGSVLDATEAAKSIKLIRMMSRVTKRDIPYAVFFTRIPAAIREKTFRDIQVQFTEAGVPVLACSLFDRAAFRSLFSFGGTHRTLQSGQVSGLEGAKDNAQSFGQEVVNYLRKVRKAA